MKKPDYMTLLAKKLRSKQRKRKPILGWQAIDPETRRVLEENNSIWILRAKYGSNALYSSIR
jgi:hypothetical protein